MDEFRKNQKYISYRIKILAYFAAALMLFLLGVCFVFMLSGGLPALVFIICALAVFAAGMIFYFWIEKPYRRMEQNLWVFSEGYSDIHTSESLEVVASPSSELLSQRISALMNQPELLKLNKRQAQYLALQNQINPHFLYNTLESIRSEALIAGLTSVADMTEALARFFRYTISKVENLVSVEEELENCMTYFSIQQYRFGSRLELAVECDPEEQKEIYAFRLPKLTLQPILENSIIHGTECKIGTGHLKIHLERTKERLLIRVSDDGVGMDENALNRLNDRLEKSGRVLEEQESKIKGGIALVNVNNRIHMLFGEEYGLHVYSMPGQGTDVEINIPTITSDRELNNKEALQ